MRGLLNNNPWKHYFYKDSMTYANESPGSYDDSGLWREGSFGLEHEISCDVQPMGLKQLAHDNGKLADCSHKVYCDPLEDIKLSTRITINGDAYEVLQVDKLGDFQIVYVKAVS